MSSGGARLQVIAQGKQDIYLTGNPQSTFFKMVYPRHTNFAIESKALYFDGTPNFGQRITCLIPKNGDLLSKLYLEVKLPAIRDASGNRLSYAHNIGHALIKEISLQIGEQEIDRQTGEWMEIWSRLTTPLNHREVLDKLVGTGGDIYSEPYIGVNETSSSSGYVTTVTIPLQFWFCKAYGLALPLIALQFHPIRVNIKLRGLDELYYSDALGGVTVTNPCPAGGAAVTVVNNGALPSFLLWADYVHLDVEECRKFAKNAHEYLITQVQYTAPTSIAATASNASVAIDFNHPVKELVWVVQRDVCRARNEHFNWSSASLFDVSGGSVPNDNLIQATLMIDGKERFEERGATYFRLIQPYQHHTRVDLNYFIYAYSFALKPEEVQPSGSLNMSLMNSVTLNLETTSETKSCKAVGASSGSGGSSEGPTIDADRGPLTVNVYGINTNVLRIAEGLGGLLFKV